MKENGVFKLKDPMSEKSVPVRFPWLLIIILAVILYLIYRLVFK